ncbi:MAG TPA: Kiwa anti-phage protein KwaB-like domain-containing protein [Puia sp.]|uniref:Kiwa anti-phage protein KwaB-like domain-containing protein n=1 Tax=Puia sp. TaxID=2045100 RepID=UPI002C379281|nr:Kiwa anti-phage protein KwaB-like domain-containing protein [Puia sp.]HVU96908.1 Kiwa anti-phage protein KwaB-like domain-containing protein [Puia sp.]
MRHLVPAEASFRLLPRLEGLKITPQSSAPGRPRQGTIDMLFFSGRLYIYSLKSFESLLNYRERMISDAEDLYDEVEQLGIFTNMDILRTRVGNNRRYLRKIAVIQSLGYYRDKDFLKRLHQINEAKGWNIQFDNGQITFTEDTIDTVLTVLQNKRLHSELTHQDFDVPSATQVP